MENKTKIEYLYKDKILLWTLYLIPILFFLYFIIFYTVNAPRADEYGIFVRITAFENHNGFIDKIVELSKKGTEHVPIYFQSLYTLYYKIFGTINFQVLAFFGNFFLLPLIILLVFKNFRPKEDKLYLFLPFCWIMLSSNYWLVAHWALTAIQIYSFILFSFLSIYFLFGESFKKFLLALFFGVLNCFTLGGGLLSIPMGVLILIYLSWKNKKIEWIKILIWIITMGAIFFMYRQLQLVENNVISNTAVMFKHPLRYICFFFFFLGNNFKHVSLFGNQEIVPMLSGVTIVLNFMYLIKVKYYEKNQVIFFFLLHLILISVLVALTRTGNTFPFVERYRFYGSVSLALSLLALIDLKSTSELLKPKANKLILLLLVCVLLALNFDKNMEDAKNHCEERKYSLAIYQSPNKNYKYETDGDIIKAGLGFAIYSIKEGINKGMYKIPESYNLKTLPKNPTVLKSIMGRVNRFPKFRSFEIKKVYKETNETSLSAFLTTYNIPIKNTNLELLLYNDNEEYKIKNIELNSFNKKRLGQQDEYISDSSINIIEVEAKLPRYLKLNRRYNLVISLTNRKNSFVASLSGHQDTIFDVFNHTKLKVNYLQ